VTKLEVLWGDNEHATRYNISVSYDGLTYHHAHAEENGLGGVEQISDMQLGAQRIKRIRMRLISPAYSGAAFSVKEFQAYGCTGQGTTSTSTSAQNVSAVASKTPTVTSLTPSMGTTAGGSDVTIRGNFFGAGVQNLAVKFGDFACDVKTVHSEGDTDVSLTFKIHVY
jgi:hypothetical protein